MLSVLGESSHVSGVNQTVRAIKSGKAVKAFLARDADDRVSKMVLGAADAAGVKVEFVDSMAQLGRACGIGVKTAAAAITGSET
jgi:large subunit ribosomal protein L7A